MKSCYGRAVALSMLLLTSRATAAAATPWQAKAAVALAVLEGEVSLPGLRAAVRVQRDAYGVAHIYAANQHDLFFAQGYVVAQDRLFQMEMWKRAGQGRLAEILGPAAIGRDTNARRLRYRGSMREEYASYAPDAFNILRAFTDGINAYIRAVLRVAGHLPVEFQIAGFRPEPWAPADCLNRLAAYSMMGNASGELLHAQLLTLLGSSAASKLFDFDPAVRLETPPGADYAGLAPQLLADVMSSDKRIPFPASSLQESNDWTVSGALTESGKPLLANDPHRVLAEPSLRYMVHLVAPGWDVIGAGEPGLPGVAAGHNQNIAWGFTIFGLDQQDLYVESLDPQDPLRYRTPAGFAKMITRVETIRVRGASAVQVPLEFTRHGPVLWADGTRALALRWVGAEPGTAGYLGSLALDRARDWNEFERAMPRWKVPSENIVYADRAGNIGEHSTGLAPLRRNFTGVLPMPGAGGYEWDGFVPNDRLPHSFNPPAGFIATANHKMIPDDFPYAVGSEWGAPNRFQRIRDELTLGSQGRKLKLADMQALQTDVVSLPARRLQGLLRQTDVARSPDENMRKWAGLLLDWDGALNADSASAALYEMWAWELRQQVTRRAVPEVARTALPRWSLELVVQALTAADPSLFGAERARARDALLLEALSAAAAQLGARQGLDASRWRWGALHMMRFRHALDAAPGLAPLLDPPPVERSGDGDVVQSTAFDSESFDQVSGASYREIFDLSDWDAGVAINVPGQSGQPGARHYADLLPIWSAGRYFPLAYSKAAVDRITTDVLRLHP